ncbi:CBS domain-containing protein [Salinimicrobium sediminilitoris]|uniref:CBS domain-containing protein n=1 Tax=Salinimicrobium sediminilitoris TaxID=2876715 RepID=UPI001E3BBA01|nr:CBS domain-containing protein [Salinimicrobium sediminilitoris]MCC8359746.1 CBS domain-containing protein [Salinimicrobium sediminilitoris]
MGIKSFQGRRAEPEKAASASVCVSDYMSTDLVTFRKDQTVFEVMELFLKHKISGGCVVDEDNKLLGVISEGDCMKHISDSRYYNMPMDNNLVEKRMTCNAMTIDADMNVLDAAKIFIENRFRRFPIVKNGELVGQLSQSDVLRAALNLKGQSWNPGI